MRSRLFLFALSVTSILFPASSRPVAAQSPGESEEFIFPIVASGFLGPIVVGNGWGPRLETTLTFVNLSNTPTSGVLRINDNRGESRGLLEGFSVEPGRPLSLNLHFQPLTPPTIPPNIDGWARLVVPKGAELLAEAEIIFFSGFSPSSPELAHGAPTSAHVRAIKPAREFRVTFTNRIGMVGTRRFAIALVNPSATTATVSLGFDKLETGFLPLVGFPQCPATVQIPPLSRISKFLDEICGQPTGTGGALPPTAGSFRIASDIPIAVAVLDVFSNGSFSTKLVQVTKP